MSVAVLIISHHEIGNALVKALKTTYGNGLPLPLETFEVHTDQDPETLLPKLKKLIAKINEGEGVLILTDLFGSTPSNIAHELQKETNIRIVTGLNLPMLIRVMNYPKLDIVQLAEKARKGGQDGIIESHGNF